MGEGPETVSLILHNRLRGPLSGVCLYPDGALALETYRICKLLNAIADHGIVNSIHLQKHEDGLSRHSCLALISIRRERVLDAVQEAVKAVLLRRTILQGPASSKHTKCLKCLI